MKNTPMRQSVLDAMPGTVTEIMETTGLKRACVSHWVKILREEGENGSIHIDDWIPTAGRRQAHYVLGPGENVPAPTQKSSGEYSRISRERWRKEQKKFAKDFEKSKNRADLTIKYGDPVLNGLMGGLFAKKIKHNEAQK